MSQYGPGDGPPPKTKTIKVKAHTRKVRVKPPGPPNFPKLVPVRPGAPTPRNATEPSTQAQRTHVHAARVARTHEIAASQAQHDVPGADMARAQRYLAAHPEIIKPPKVKKTGTGLFGTIDNVLAGKATTGAVHFAEGAASRVAPLAARVASGPIGLGGDYLLKKATGLDVGGTIGKFAGNAGKDVVDLTANAIPSVYVPGKAVAQGHVGKAAKMLAQPFIDTAKHPVKSFIQHPVGTVLLVRGGEGAIGHGAGRVLRGLPSETTRRIASTERAPKVIPGTRVEQQRPYSKDVIEKGVQVVHERRQAKRGGTPTVMSERDIARRVTEEHQAAKTVTQHHQAQAATAAHKAIGRKPTAAVNLAAQGITDGTFEDLHAYAIELEHEAHSLSGDELAANERTQKLVHDALKNHDAPTVQRAARAYAAHAEPLNQAVVEHGLVKADTAEATRLAGPAIRRLGATSESKRGARAGAREERVAAERVKRRAGKVVVKAEQGLQQARGNARVSVARRKQSPALRAAEGHRNVVVADLARLRQTSSRDAAATVAKTNVGLERAVADARVATAKGNGSARLAVVEKQHRQAVSDLARLKRQYRGKPYTIEMGVNMRAARQAVREAEVPVKTERRRIAGVPPAQHDALLRAIAAADEAKQTARQAGADDVARARAAVRAADEAVQVERRRIAGVAPAEHEALLTAIATKDEARNAQTQARGAAKTATTRHRAIKKAPYVARGEPVTIANVRAAMGPNALEPAFVSHAGAHVRGSALPVEMPSVPTKINRSGEAVRKGTFDASPEALVRQSVETQRLVDAAQARGKFVDDFGYRSNKDAPPEIYKTQAVAENVARPLKEKTGVEWSAMSHHDGGFVLVPKVAKARLAEHAEPRTAPLAKVSARWRRNVLGFSPKWFTGNTIEAAVRAGVAHARSGPLIPFDVAASYVTGRRGLSALERVDPKAAEQLRARAIGAGGQSGMVARTAREATQSDHVASNAIARFAHSAGQLRGAKGLSNAYQRYTDIVFNQLNGRIENQFRTAMLGKALRDSPLMDGKTVRISGRAVQDAVDGLQNTNAQVALARAVDRMYGQYDKFNPQLQGMIVQYTPFAAWTLNAIRFLGVVLPRDHPMLTSLIVSANLASEKWRREHGLDFFASGAAPGWLQGSIPGKGGSHLRVSRYTPFGLGANEGGPLGGLPSLLLPQFSESLQNFAGRNWQYKQLSKTGNHPGRNAIAGVVSFLEGQIPAASQVTNLTGVRLPNMADSTKIKPDVGTRARSQFDPFMYTAGSPVSQATPGTAIKIAPVKIKPVKIRPVHIKPIKLR